ncbi:macro domain-containing protein [Bacillus sp. M6-12]|uniref:macro domain-containing protein n=1 Tax=Bacillus sp. M6-12 TaxID=2054166 RepID=UPI002155E31A|nr:macro domain-containing protein [Bacillus sp. M6-12]
MIKVVEGDLLHQEVEVIVNAWNRNFIPYWMLLPHGVSRAIKQKAGTKPFKEVQKHGFLGLGEAILTSAGKLSYKGIIHVAGIGVFWNSSEKAIRLSVQNAMKIVNEQGFTSVAFPLIGCGAGKFEEDRAIAIMKEELNKISFQAEVVLVKYSNQ